MLSFLTVLFLSIHSSIAPAKDSEQAVYNRLIAISAVGTKILFSYLHSFDFESADDFVYRVNDLLMSQNPLTKEDLLPLEVETELILNQVDSANRLLHYYRKKEIKPKLLKLIETIQNRSNLRQHSHNRFLVDLSSFLVEDLVHYRETKEFVKNLRISLKQHCVVLKTVVYANYINRIEINSEILELLFAAGNYLLTNPLSNDPITTGLVENFLKLIYIALLIPLDKPLNHTDLSAITLQAQSILTKITPFESAQLEPSKLGLDKVSRLLNSSSTTVDVDRRDNEISLSSIVANDLLKLRIVDHYEETLLFLDHYNQSSNVSDRLIPYLRNSVINRHYIVPDYDDEVDILAAIDSAKNYFEDKSENAQYRLLSVYLLVKYWMGTSNDMKRAILAFKKLGNLDFIGWNLAKQWYFKDSNERKPVNVTITPPPEILFPTQNFASDQQDASIPYAILTLKIINMINTMTFSSELAGIPEFVAEIQNPVFSNFCPGSEKFREFLKHKLAAN
jgi:hypothetical protein